MKRLSYATLTAIVALGLAGCTSASPPLYSNLDSTPFTGERITDEQSIEVAIKNPGCYAAFANVLETTDQVLIQIWSGKLESNRSRCLAIEPGWEHVSVETSYPIGDREIVDLYEMREVDRNAFDKSYDSWRNK